MQFVSERAREQVRPAADFIRQLFGEKACAPTLDAAYLDARRTRAVGFVGLPYAAPICQHLLGERDVAAFIMARSGSLLFFLNGEVVTCETNEGLVEVPDAVVDAVKDTVTRIIAGAGVLGADGNFSLDLKAYPVSSHYAVNLLLGNRAGYPYPLCTTPKGAVDGLGRGSFAPRAASRSWPPVLSWTPLKTASPRTVSSISPRPASRSSTRQTSRQTLALRPARTRRAGRRSTTPPPTAWPSSAPSSCCRRSRACLAPSRPSA